MYLPRRFPECEIGFFEFLNASFAKAVRGGQICCPCNGYKNCYLFHRDEVFNHIKGQAFVDNYCLWGFHS